MGDMSNQHWLSSKKDKAQLLILRKRAILKQRGLCFWCHEPISASFDENHPKRLTGDHLIPLHEGGKTVPGNIVAACRDCNNGRHPYLNRSKASEPVCISVGNDEVHSPFAILKTRA
jgi:5-methylcytosine-specific restriction endonuclease McrA